MDRDKKETCTITVEFEDLALGEPVVATLNCEKSSSCLEYYLRKAVQKEKRIPPIDQNIEKINSNKYLLKVRQRNPTNKLTIYGHFTDEYNVQIDNNDNVIDLKFLLAPLIDTKPEYIQFNYNTLRKLNDNENIIQSNCLASSIKIMFWIELGDGIKGKETPIYRSVPHLTTHHPYYFNMGDSIRKICKKHGNKVKTFGVRKYLDKNDLTLRGDYEYIDYEIINNKITLIAAAFCSLGLSFSNNSKIGLCSRNRREWLLCDYASSLQSIVNIPLYSTLDKNAIEYITNHAEIELIVCDNAQCEQIYNLRKNNKIKSLKYIILMDYELPDQLYINEKKHTFDYTVTDLEKMGEVYIQKNGYKDVISKSDDLCTIMYTSGTTGNPKGVMMTHRSLMTVLATMLTFDPDQLYNIQSPVHLSYLPLAHVFEKIVSLWSLLKGRRTCFYCGDHDRLIEDMLLVKPQVMVGVPRIWQKIQDTVVNKINTAPWIVRKVFNYAYNNKLNKIQNREEALWIFEKTLFKKFRDAFGGELKFIFSGGAPLSKETAEFLKICLADQVTEAYGLTESPLGATTSEYDLKYGHVGVPTVANEIKLVSVPSMNYLVTDKPCPRGEIYLRGGSVFAGYYKNPKKTADVLDTKTGWFKTGDIGLWRNEGRLQIIDRVKNIFKLSQGEYVRPQYISNVYKQSKFITNIFVYGDSFQSYLVGIIVVDKEALQTFFNINNIDDINDNFINDNKIIELYKNDLKLIGDKAELNGFERVKKFKLITEDFTVENGLVTTSMKLKRNACKIKFEKEINQLYAKKSKL